MGAEDLAATELKMTRVLAAMERDFHRLRTGAASASLLDDVTVDHHGRRARLVEVASIAIPDPRQIVIVPWDPSSLRAIGTAISQSRIGLTPTLDGPAIRLYVPAMSEDRRHELVGPVHRRMDQARVEIRAIRHEALAGLKDRERSRVVGADDARREAQSVQHLTDQHIAEIDRFGRAKEATVLRL
jgi:ribosome recycling factor